jgi:erythronate-4-phosphate dehydrogenase
MKIVADRNVSHVSEAFGSLGRVVKKPGRQIDSSDLSDADILVTRNLTTINAETLDGTAVRFVASATIGTDHVDHEYIKRRGIGFSNAPGSNARAVAEFVAACLIELEGRGHLRLKNSVLGVVGVGHVGREVVELGRALGMTVLCNDPPRQRAEPDGEFIELDKICAQSDVITLHAPLTDREPDRTRHLFDRQRLAKLSDRTILINTARGAVINNEALLEELDRGRLHAVLDTWEFEPCPLADLLQHPRVLIATPHIAGYSAEGKLAATDITYRAACDHFGQSLAWDSRNALGPASDAEIIEIRTLSDAVRHTYDLGADDRNVRDVASFDPPERSRAFDSLRDRYNYRREFGAYSVSSAGENGLIDALTSLGFRRDAEKS